MAEGNTVSVLGFYKRKNVSNLLFMQLCLEYLQTHIKQNVLCGCIFQYKAVGIKLIRQSRMEVKAFLIYIEKMTTGNKWDLKYAIYSSTKLA